MQAQQQALLPRAPTTLIRDPRQQPRPGDRLLRAGACRMVVKIETGFNGGITAVHWVNGHQHRELCTVPKHARDTAYSSTVGSWRAWAKDGATILSAVPTA